MFGLAKLGLATLLPVAAMAQASVYGSNSTAMPDADGKYTIEAEGIRAMYIPYGASLSNLFINDTQGIERDIVLGFDNASHYSVDRLHPHLGGIPGRYANRIKNSSFEIDGNTYHVFPNENNGEDTLHGGPDGWDWRNWTAVAATSSSITFQLIDPAGAQGFPGEVIAYATYSVSKNRLHYTMTATSTQVKTPIMMTSHNYWNLDAFQNPHTNNVLNNTIYMPYSGQRVGVDGILIPNGTILPNERYSVNDFWSTPKQLGANLTGDAALGNCGTGCTGYDTCWLVNRDQLGPYDWQTEGPIASIASGFTGIQVDIYSDQQAFQLYSCESMNGTLLVKNTQGFFNDTSRPRVVEREACFVTEVEDWIDAINQPEWQREKRNIWGPEDGQYVLNAFYDFSINNTLISIYNASLNAAGY